MFFPRSVAIVISLTCLLGIALAANPPAAQKPTPSTPVPALLPQEFEGWQMQGTPQVSTDPAVADAANAAVLKEYGFSDLATCTYTRTRDDGRTLKIRAARFADASGAFGAYTFYLQPGMAKLQISENPETDKTPEQGVSNGKRVLFYRGHVVVEAQFSEVSPMSAQQLRRLAEALPLLSGNSGNLPSFIEFMPSQGYVANTQKYVMGPSALAAQSPPVSADLIDFNASSEVSMARYNTASGEATLTLISYPTPQLAAEHLRRIYAAYHIVQPKEGAAVVESAGSFFPKRTGPILAIASGPISASDAKSLLAMVSWEANVTWHQASESAEVKGLTQLILNIVVLCGIVGGLAVVAGVAFGGIRILMKRMYPDKVFDRPEHMEFISLRLTETVVKGIPEPGTEGGRQAP